MSAPISASAYAATLLRLALGMMCIAHALLKYLVFTLPGTAQFFSQVGLPGWLAYPVFILEMAAGLAFILGWHSRWFALSLLPVMLGACWVHAGNGWVHTSNNGGWEYPAFLTISLLVQALLGDGVYAARRAVAPRTASDTLSVYQA